MLLSARAMTEPRTPQQFSYWELAKLFLRRSLQLGAEVSPTVGEHLGIMTNAQGHKLQTRTWPVAQPKGIVVFCHGYGTATTHLPAWDRVAKVHTTHDLLCVGFDYPGHGASEGRRNRIESVESLADDVLQLVDLVTAQHPSIPVFLRGQSLGGLVALTAALRRRDFFAGLALGAPAYELRYHLTFFAPRAITDGGEACHARIASLTDPVACFQGVSDSTCDARGARHLITNCSSQRKALYLYDGMGRKIR